MFKLPRFVKFATLLPLASSCAIAVQDTVWDGADGDWYDRSSWSAGMPSPSTNAIVPSGAVEIRSYSQARLLRVGMAKNEDATLTMAEGGTLEIGSAGVSLLGVGDGSRGELIQEGGRIVMGNGFYLGGFLASGDGEAHYLMRDGILTIHSGDLVLGGNTTGSSSSSFEQRGGSVSVQNLLIGSERYRGMQGSNANRSNYSAVDGELTINEWLKIGSGVSGGKGEVEAGFTLGSRAKVQVTKGLEMIANEQSRPGLSFLIDGDAPGLLRLSPDADVSLGGQFEIKLQGGVALLNASEFSLIEAKREQVSGELSMAGNGLLWRFGNTDSSAVHVSLNEQSKKAVLNRNVRPREAFISSSCGYVVLEGLAIGRPFDLFLNVDPGSGETLESLRDGFIDAGFDARIESGKYIAIRASAAESTLYFAWDFGGSLSPSRISAVAL